MPLHWLAPSHHYPLGTKALRRGAQSFYWVEYRLILTQPRAEFENYFSLR